MGFLSDVGRANVLGQVLEYGSFQQRNRQLQMRQELIDMQKQQQEAEQAQQEKMTRPMLLSELVGKGSEAKPNQMKVFADAVKMAGGRKTVGPDGNEDFIVTQQDMPNIQKFMQLQQQFHVPLLWAERADNDLEIQGIMKQMGKGKPQEEFARNDRLEQLKKRNADILREISGPDKASEEDQYSEPFPASIGGKEILLRRNLRTNKVEQVSAGPVGGTTVNVGQNKLDIEAGKELIKNLPKLQKQADDSATAIDRIDTMLGLLSRGAGGRLGQAKAAVAPWLETIGISTKGLTEAQLYERLSTTLGGSMRMAIIGPGPVSDYEQELLKKVSGGGATAAAAAKELLDFYRKSAIRNIDRYNAAAKDISRESPMAGRLYTPIEYKKQDPLGIR